MTENKKKIFSLVSAAVLTLIIVGVWFHFSKNSNSDQVAGEQESKLSETSPIQVIKDQFSQAFASFKSQTVSTSSTSTVEVVEATSTN